jgi:Xaa-Pro aminopeptidase
MGLDTHDYGILTEPMQANMVFTVEPGIYIPAEGFVFAWKTTHSRKRRTIQPNATFLLKRMKLKV